MLLGFAKKAHKRKKIGLARFRAKSHIGFQLRIMESGSVRSMSKKAIAAPIIFLLLLLFHCANCSSYDMWLDYGRVIAERMRNYDDIQPDELTRNYPILKKSSLIVNKGDILEVKMGKLFSRKTKRHESYYSLPFCRLNNNTVESTEEFEKSPYVFKMLEPQLCNVVCRVTLDYKTANALRKKMEDKYNVNMVLDGLPLVRQRSDVYQLGYPIGDVLLYGRYSPVSYYIKNHLIFTVKYHKDSQTNSMRIVEFSVQPHSIDYEDAGKLDEKGHPLTCYSDAASMRWQKLEPLHEIIFTYDVLFEGVADPVAHGSSR